MNTNLTKEEKQIIKAAQRRDDEWPLDPACRVCHVIDKGFHIPVINYVQPLTVLIRKLTTTPKRKKRKATR